MASISLKLRGPDPDPAYRLSQADVDGNYLTIQTAVNGHDAAIATLQGGMASVLTRLSAAESAAQGFDSALATQGPAITSLGTRMSAAESAVGGLQASQGGFSSGLSNLGTRVSTAEGGITSLGAAQTGILNRLGSAEGTISTLQTSLGTAQSAIAGKVSTDDARLSNARPIADGTYGVITVAGGAAALADKGVALSKLADVATARVLGRVTTGSGPLELLTVAQLQAMVGVQAPTAAQVTSAFVAASSDSVLGPQLGAAAAAILTALGVPARQAYHIGMTEGIIPNGYGIGRNVFGTGLEGYLVEEDVVATQAEVLAGINTDKAITAASVGGLATVRYPVYAATMDMDFSGDTPPWMYENEIAAGGALVLRANTFPDYMKGKDFSIRVVRASGTGNVSVADKSGGAVVEYRRGLSSSDFPALGAAVDSSVLIRARCMSPTKWRIENFEEPA